MKRKKHSSKEPPTLVQAVADKDCGEMAMTISNLEGLQETYLDELNTMKDGLKELIIKLKYNVTEMLVYHQAKEIRNIDNVHDRTSAEVQNGITNELRALIK